MIYGMVDSQILLLVILYTGFTAYSCVLFRFPMFIDPTLRLVKGTELKIFVVYEKSEIIK